MRKVISSFEYQEFDSASELQPEDRSLLEMARSATKTSHAPYSNYHVGAAVRLANGKEFTGSNQENAAFPAALCAERVAVFAAVSTYPDTPIVALAVSATADAFPVTEPVPPCGMCRQSIVEYEIKFGNKIRIILSGETGKVFIIHGMSTLLPFTFFEKGLQKAK
jgi:cytidine deaminase